MGREKREAGREMAGARLEARSACGWTRGLADVAEDGERGEHADHHVQIMRIITLHHASWNREVTGAGAGPGAWAGGVMAGDRRQASSRRVGRVGTVR